MSHSARQRILARIYGHGRGWVFSPADFAADFKRYEIDNTLEDLVKEDKIIRLARGIYLYPRFSKFLNKWATADIYDIARTIARKHSWKLQPTETTVLNYLGLITQFPLRCVLLSSGPNRRYRILNQDIIFRHIPAREAAISDEDTMLAVRAVKSVSRTGTKYDVDEFLNRLAKCFTKEQWLKIRKNAGNCSSAIVQKNIDLVLAKGDFKHSV